MTLDKEFRVFTKTYFSRESFNYLKSIVAIILLCCCVLQSQAQKYDLPLNLGISQELLLVKAKQDSMLHTSIKPINQWYISDQSFGNLFEDSSDYYYDFTVLLYQKHLLEIHKKDVHIGMDILLDYDVGRRFFKNAGDLSNKIVNNTRGFRIVANIGENVSLETRFYENQFFLPYYIDSVVNTIDVVR